MSKKDIKETKTIIIKTGDRIETYSKCFNIDEYKLDCKLWVEFDRIINTGVFIPKQKYIHIKTTGVIITTIQNLD